MEIGKLGDLIKAITKEVQDKLDVLYQEVGAPKPGSELDQAGLINGKDIVDEHLSSGEYGVVFEHLLYMIKEPRLHLSARSFAALVKVGNRMKMDPSNWEHIQYDDDA